MFSFFFGLFSNYCGITKFCVLCLDVHIQLYLCIDIPPPVKYIYIYIYI